MLPPDSVRKLSTQCGFMPVRGEGLEVEAHEWDGADGDILEPIADREPVPAGLYQVVEIDADDIRRSRLHSNEDGSWRQRGVGTGSAGRTGLCDLSLMRLRTSARFGAARIWRPLADRAAEPAAHGDEVVGEKRHQGAAEDNACQIVRGQYEQHRDEGDPDDRDRDSRGRSSRPDSRARLCAVPRYLCASRSAFSSSGMP